MELSTVTLVTQVLSTIGGSALMFISYQYFRQYNDDKEISDEFFKDFYKVISNTREFGGEFSHFDHLLRGRFHNILGNVYNSVVRKQPKNILDIGSGNGVNLPISKLFEFIEFHALDYAEKTVEVAKKDYPDVQFKVGDAFNLPYPDASFDMAIMSRMLVLYRNQEDRYTLLKEAQRILSKDGILILVLINDTFIIRNAIKLAMLVGKLKNQKLPEDFGAVHLNKKDVIASLNDIAFDIEEVIYTSKEEGIVQLAKYLNMSKFNRTFGKSESESGKRISQNIKQDIFDSIGKRVWGVYTLSKILPRQFCWTGIYILRKQFD